MHVKNSHREIQCTLCEDKFANEDELGDHRERMHTKVVLKQCDITEIYSNKKKMLRNTIGANHENCKNVDEEMPGYLVSASDSEASSFSSEDSSDFENSETESGGSSS